LRNYIYSNIVEDFQLHKVTMLDLMEESYNYGLAIYVCSHACRLNTSFSLSVKWKNCVKR